MHVWVPPLPPSVANVQATISEGSGRPFLHYSKTKTSRIVSNNFVKTPASCKLLCRTLESLKPDFMTLFGQMRH